MKAPISTCMPTGALAPYASMPNPLPSANTGAKRSVADAIRMRCARTAAVSRLTIMRRYAAVKPKAV